MAIRRPIRLASDARHTLGGQRECSVDEDARSTTDEIRDRAGSGEADQARRAPTSRHRNARVAEHEAADPVGVGGSPSERDRATPVVGGEHDGPVDAERGDHVVEIADPLGIAPARDAVGEAHPQLIDGDDAVPVAEPSQKAAPEVRPCRIAVHAHDGGERLARAALQHVPHSGNAVAAGNRDQTRPIRIHTPATKLLRRRQIRSAHPRSHQTSSVKLVLRPDPMPMHSTRSPGSMSAATPARVIGIAAGPTLP